MKELHRELKQISFVVMTSICAALWPPAWISMRECNREGARQHGYKILMLELQLQGMSLIMSD